MSRVALVTGHSRGLGAAIAEDLLKRGLRVMGVARKGNPALALFSGFGEISLDLGDVDALTAWTASEGFRRFLAGCTQAVLVNNAGLVTPVGPAGRQGAAELARSLHVNVHAPLMLSDAFCAATEGCADRRIAHVSSGAGRKPYPGWSSYCATKAALDMHAAATALDQIPGLRIASVAPGVIDTDMQALIRGTSETDFPIRAHFEALKRERQLLSPAAAARQFNDYLLGERFGQQVIADTRL